MQQGASTLASYAHNGQGQRIIKTANGQTTVFHYDQAGQLIAESDASGQFINEYITLNGQFLTLVTAGQPAPGPAEFVIDNSEPGTSQTGSWKNRSYSGAVNSNYLLAMGAVGHL